MKIKSSLQSKLIAVFVVIILIIGALNLFIYMQTNKMISTMDAAYESNVEISFLQKSLRSMQDSLYEYLNGEYNSLKSYYSNRNSLEEQMEKLNDKPSSDSVKVMQKNIKELSRTYLKLTDEAVAGHRGTDLLQYMESYEGARVVYGYLETYIYTLNAETFNINTKRYSQLSKIQEINQVINIFLIVLASILAIIIIIILTGRFIEPLSELAKRADELGHGNLDLPPLVVSSEDEIGLVTRAFNSMVVRLNDNIRIQQERIIEENRLKEDKLRLESFLKDSQLGALQAQINPHFLYNTLNAGSQLAMMEDAETTTIFLEKVAEYFRYNLHKSGKDVYLSEELSQVENYIYIMNTRYAGAIHFIKDIEENLPVVKLPGMVLQPIMENAIDHGLKSIEEGEKRLILSVKSEDNYIVVSVGDNGFGFPKDKAYELLNNTEQILQSPKDNHGIGMANVISRLRLYYDRRDVMKIGSLEDDMGTLVSVYLPVNGEE